MEQVTSRIDREIANNYRRITQRMLSSEDEEMFGGNSKPVSLANNPGLFCNCRKVTPRTEANRCYNETSQRMWYALTPSHCHDGTHHDCNICCGVVTCNDIPNIIDAGNKFESMIAGKRQPKNDLPDCSADAVSTISQEATKVLNYIYSQYKTGETNQPITEGMISHAMQTLKLNVLHTDLPRLFELVISKHKRGLGRKDYVEHPLSYIVCHMKELINPLLVFEKSIEGYSYNELLNSLRIQSSEYDPNILQGMSLKFDISTMVHPLFVAMFWRQLPRVENMCVESDQFQLLKNIHLTHEKIKPSSYNFELTTARWNEKSPIAFFGVTNVIDTEIKRVLCHVYLKKIIHRLRTGELHSLDSNKLVSWLQKVFIFNSYDTGDEAEQLITSFMNLFLIRPVKMFVQDQVMLGSNCGYMVNSPAEDYMKECPFIYCETTSQIGGVPYSQMPSELNCLRYDKVKNKAILHLGAINTRQVVLAGNCQPALTCDGIIPIFTRRKAALTYRDASLLTGEDAIEYINTAYLNVQTDYNIDTKSYKLVSVLCYQTIKPETGILVTDKEIAAGYFALVLTDRGWFRYDVNSFSGANNVEVLKQKYIDWARRQYQDWPIYDMARTQESTLELPTAYLADKFFDKYGHGMIDGPLLTIPQNEAMDLINRQSCLLIYSEDYDTYKLALARNRFV